MSFSHTILLQLVQILFRILPRVLLGTLLATLTPFSDKTSVNRSRCSSILQSSVENSFCRLSDLFVIGVVQRIEEKDLWSFDFDLRYIPDSTSDLISEKMGRINLIIFIST